MRLPPLPVVGSNLPVLFEGESAFIRHRQLMEIVNQFGRVPTSACKEATVSGVNLRTPPEWLPVRHAVPLKACAVRGSIGHKIAAHLLVFLQRAGELVKSCASLPSSSSLVGVTRVVNHPPPVCECHQPGVLPEPANARQQKRGEGRE